MEKWEEQARKVLKETEQAGRNRNLTVERAIGLFPYGRALVDETPLSLILPPQKDRGKKVAKDHEDQINSQPDRVRNPLLNWHGNLQSLGPEGLPFVIAFFKVLRPLSIDWKRGEILPAGEVVLGKIRELDWEKLQQVEDVGPAGAAFIQLVFGSNSQDVDLGSSLV